MEVTGRIKKIFEEQTFQSGFRKKEIVVTTQEQYPQDLLVQFTQDRVNLLGSYNEGDEVKISINLRGREWTSPDGVVKYFVSIDAWRMEKVGAGQDMTTSAPPELPPITSETAFTSEESDPDDLPF